MRRGHAEKRRKTKRHGVMSCLEMLQGTSVAALNEHNLSAGSLGGLSSQEAA